MCVIIYIPTGQTITEKEIKEAWSINPHGAGLIVRNPANKQVYFKKGILKLKDLLKEVRQFNKKNYELVLHLRITSRGKTCKEQTHPFKQDNLEQMQGFLKHGSLLAMNGTIIEQDLVKGQNDTFSFIAQHLQGAKITGGILDIIYKATDAHWAAVSKNGVLITEDFIKYEGKYYSNLNHITVYNYYNEYETEDWTIFIDPDLLEKLHPNTQERVEDFITSKCYNWNCNCSNCLQEAETPAQVLKILRSEYF